MLSKLIAYCSKEVSIKIVIFKYIRNVRKVVTLPIVLIVLIIGDKAIKYKFLNYSKKKKKEIRSVCRDFVLLNLKKL